MTGRTIPLAIPVRMCVGCRVRAPASDLVRVTVVKVDGVSTALPDYRKRRPGRGASVHPDPVCLDLAQRRRAFPRALRHEGPLSITALQERVAGLGLDENRSSTETGSGSNNAMSAR